MQIAPLEKQQQDGRTIQYYPVHAHYAVTCIYGDEQMRAEVDLTAYFYQDSFGAWKTDTPTGDEDQSWDNIHSDVRCRVQSLAHVVLDSKGKITSSTPSKDQGFIGCTVEPKAAE